MLALALLLQLAHLLVVLLLPSPLLASNVIQLLVPLMAWGICSHQRRLSTNLVGRRCWSWVSCAFGIWALAQACFLFFLCYPQYSHLAIRPDDALWTLFGLPLLLAVNTTHDEVDQIGRFDRLQAILFFIVIYLLIFLPSVRLSFDTGFLIQDLALLLCCLLRLPICTRLRERRFFVRLVLFLLVYGPLTMAGDALHDHGWPAGTLVDIVWTLPTTFFVVLVLRDSLPVRDSTLTPSRLVKAVRSMQGLSVAALSFLSISVAALLAYHRPLLGSLCLAACFALFALRTNARERAWHRAHGQLEETVLQDALTGLGNRIRLRNSLTEHLGDPIAHGPAVLLFADLDRFKIINDSLGHILGDRLLIEVAARLQTAAPAGSVVCRLGGDEFVVLTTANSPVQAQHRGETLLEALHHPFQLGDHVLRCTASIGVVMAVPGQATDELLRTADHAMYRAKQLGKDRVQLFDASLMTQMSTRWQMEADLRDCIERQELEVAFQPILTMEGGAISGFEALARWSHPEHGSIPPSDFIPLAEDAGLILALGAQILEKACRQVAEWNRLWQTELSVSVNVSPRQFADTGLLAVVLDILERTGLPPSLLRLEITESALLVHENTVKQVLTEARAHGIHISLDDFGTGYSSLSFLLSLPVDEVKVDRSFVSDMHADPHRRELVRTVIHLGHSLGKRVVAEGVETEQDFRELVAMGCECAQGWLISRPLAAEAMQADLPAIIARSARTAHSLARPEPPAFAASRQPEGWREVLRTPVIAFDSAT